MEFAELEEMERLFPRDDGWAQAALITSTIHNAIEDLRVLVSNVTGNPTKPRHLEPQELHPGAAYKTTTKKTQPISEVKRKLAFGNPTTI